MIINPQIAGWGGVTDWGNSFFDEYSYSHHWLMMMAVVMEHERMDQQDANSYQIPPVSSRIEQFPFVIYYSGGRNCNLSNI